MSLLREVENRIGYVYTWPSGILKYLFYHFTYIFYKDTHLLFLREQYSRRNGCSIVSSV